VGKASSRAPISFPCAFLFKRILSFAQIGLPHFRHTLDSFDAVLIDCPKGNSIFAEVLIASVNDFSLPSDRNMF
jgi:hypothetical protein